MFELIKATFINYLPCLVTAFVYIIVAFKMMASNADVIGVINSKIQLKKLNEVQEQLKSVVQENYELKKINEDLITRLDKIIDAVEVKEPIDEPKED